MQIHDDAHIRERIARLESASEYSREVITQHAQRINNLNGRISNNEGAIQGLIHRKGDLRARVVRQGEVLSRIEQDISKAKIAGALMKYIVGGGLLTLVVMGKLSSDAVDAVKSWFGL